MCRTSNKQVLNLLTFLFQAKFKEEVGNTIPKWTAATLEKYLADFAAGSLSTDEEKDLLRNELLRIIVEKQRVQQLKDLKVRRMIHYVVYSSKIFRTYKNEWRHLTYVFDVSFLFAGMGSQPQ